MSNPAAISGDYVDLRFIKSRKVLQIVIELPIEAGPSVVAAFGTPLPDTNVPVAVARLEQQPEQTKQRKKFDEISRAQQAGILCNNGGFQKWLEQENSVNFHDSLGRTDDAATAVRRLCGVNSRADLDTTPGAGEKWDTIVSEYRAWPGFVT